MVRSAKDRRDLDGLGRSVSGTTNSSSAAVVASVSCCVDAFRESAFTGAGLAKRASFASLDDGSGGAPMLALVARGVALANSPDTARVRAEGLRNGVFGIAKLALLEDEARAGARRRSCDGAARSLGLRRSPPERLSREGFARSAMVGRDAVDEDNVDATVFVVVEERTGRRDDGRRRPLGRIFSRWSSMVRRLAGHR